MLFNGRDPSASGWTCTSVGKWLDAPRVVRASVAVPNIGAVLPFTSATTDPRVLPMSFRNYAATLADRVPNLRTLQRLFAGRLYIRSDDWAGRIVRATAGEFVVTTTPTGAAFANPVVDVDVQFTCWDGASYDAEPRVLVLSTTPAAVALGERPSAGVVQWSGAWSVSTARTIIIRRPGGAIVSTTTITSPATDSLASGDFLEIDAGRRYLTKVTTTGVRTDAIEAGWTVANWFVFDSAYGDPANARDITAELSAGSAILYYRRAYTL